jgi:serine/threonine protein kinase
MGEFCHSLATSLPVGEQGLFSFVFACCQAVTVVVILYWLHRQQRWALSGDATAARALILPIYSWILWFVAGAILLDVGASIILPFKASQFSVPRKREYLYSAVYGTVWASYHFILEFIAFLLLQDGAGIRTTKIAAKLSGTWSIITFAVHFIAYLKAADPGGRSAAFMLLAGWEGVMLLFYAALRFLPISVLFRRPALYTYAMFWMCFRTVDLVAIALQYYNYDEGTCLYMFSSWVVFGLCKPYIVYRTLLRDSQYWLGAFIHTGLTRSKFERAKSTVVRQSFVSSGPNLGRSQSDDSDRHRRRQQQQQQQQLHEHQQQQQQQQQQHNGTTNYGATSDTNDRRVDGTTMIPPVHANSADGGYYREDRQISYDITSPLLGQRLNLHSARELALGMDLLMNNVRIINFAYLSLGKKYTILGAGGTSRVYRGTYKGEPVAIKMIYCMDLTPAVVSNFYEEAIVLSALQHPNVVKLIGVCVLPPSLCLVMELCESNMFDFIHSRPSLTTSRRADVDAFGNTKTFDLDWGTKLSLAIGCARGVAYLHTLDVPILHMDIKTLNFLVTRDLQVKICDFEWSRRKGDTPVTVTIGDSEAGTLPFNNPSSRSRPFQAAGVAAGVLEAPTDGDDAATVLGSLSDHKALSHLSNDRKQQAESMPVVRSNSNQHSHTARSRRTSSRIPDSLNWTAPEVIRTGEFTEKADCYSLGIVIWEICTGRVPFDDPVFSRNQGGQYAIRCALAQQNYHPPIPDDIPPAIENLLLNIWHPDMSRRFTAQQIVEELALLESNYRSDPAFLTSFLNN